MDNILTKFSRIIMYVLLTMAMIFISFQTIELLWETVQSFSSRFREVGLDYNPRYGKTILVLFFNVLLALEVLETIRIFQQSHTVKVRIILLICLIAISRKIFVMDIEQANALEDFGIAALIITLSFSYYLVSRQSITESHNKEMHDDQVS